MLILPPSHPHVIPMKPIQDPYMTASLHFGWSNHVKSLLGWLRSTSTAVGFSFHFEKLGPLRPLMAPHFAAVPVLLRPFQGAPVETAKFQRNIWGTMRF